MSVISTDRGEIYLTKKDDVKTDLVWICITDNEYETESEGFVNKQQAIQIIEHLQEQFKIK